MILCILVVLFLSEVSKIKDFQDYDERNILCYFLSLYLV
nr:MAG TPA: hypothetical protein [Caudoviricetes sp.]